MCVIFIPGTWSLGHSRPGVLSSHWKHQLWFGWNPGCFNVRGQCDNNSQASSGQFTHYLYVCFLCNFARGEIYVGHGHLCVCLCVCLSVPCRIPTLMHGPGCNLGNGRGCRLVVHCWADLQSVHRFRCYGNIVPNANVSECLYSLYAWLSSL